MDFEQALVIFRELEGTTYEFDNDQYPVFDVRLDAGIDRDEQREVRLFVRVSNGIDADETADFAMGLFELAREHGASLSFENNGIELS